MTGRELRAAFIGEAGSRLFVLLRSPPGPGGECTLVVPPFAEEMNKCRRIVSDLARRECDKGRGVVCVDLSGTGDSDGEFGTARVDRWIGDLSAAAAWSTALGWRVTAVLGIRLGAILAARWMRQHSAPLARAVFWQPVANGARHMDQFLRLRVMASRMEDDRGETVADLRGRLQAGETVEVAGYELSGKLFADIEALDLVADSAPGFPPIRWFDVVADEALPVVPATRRVLEQLRVHGGEVHHLQVPGEPFWASTEIVTNSVLVAAV